MANINDLQKICMTLTGVTEDIKWKQDLCFSIGEKMFLVISLNSVPTSVSFKVPSDQFEEMIERCIFRPAPYLARYKWVSVEDIEQLSLETWVGYIHTSYKLVVSKLSKKVRKELGLIENE